MKKLLTILSFILLANIVSGQNSNNYTYNIDRGNPIIVKVETIPDKKEAAYIKYDSATGVLVKRGDQKLIHFGFWYYLNSESQIASAAAAVALQINDDGTVKDWPRLSDALDRWKIIKQRYFNQIQFLCNCLE